MSLVGLRVLIVEDDSLLAMLVEAQLEEFGCAVVGSAGRLGEAVDKARSLPVDVGLLDVNLAGEMSYPVAAVLRARNVPVVFATGYGPSGLPPEWRSVPILTKPFMKRQLADALASAIRGVSGSPLPP